MRAADQQECAVGIVIVNYCGEDDIVRCFRSLAELDLCGSSGLVEIALVDNASPDGSGERLQQRRDELLALLGPRFQLQLLFSPRNDGFAAGNNLGIDALKSRQVTHLWLLNPDTTVQPGALAALIAEAAPLRVCGSKVLYAPEGTGERSKIWSAGGTLDRAQQQVGMRGLGESDVGQYEVIERCDYIPGCSMFLPLALIQRIGAMPERFFMYFEETEWCERMSRVGIELLYVPKSVVFHHFADEKMGRPFTVYYYNRNERLFWFRWGTWRQRLALICRTLFRSIPQALRAHRAAPDLEHRSVFRAQLLAYRDFLLGRSGKLR